MAEVPGTEWPVLLHRKSLTVAVKLGGTSHSASSARGEVGVGWGAWGGSSSQPPLSLCTMTNVVTAYYHKRSTKTIFPWGCTLEGSGWLLESTELVE